MSTPVSNSTPSPRGTRRTLVVAATVAFLGVPLVTVALAAPTPSAVTVGAGGAAAVSAHISGGPLTGTGDAGGLTAPTSCAAPSCESFAVTLKAPAGWTSTHDLGLTASVSFAAASPLTGVDDFILDSSGNVLGQYTSSASPATVSADKLKPGTYTLEVTGDVGTSTTYSGSVTATSTPLSTVPAALPTQLTFAPSSVVSPVLVGAEPQVAFELPQANSLKGAVNANRGFIDWPLSSRTNIGTLWRTENGGDSWRQIYDTTCAPRERPNCFTGGGGDTVVRVNNYNGDVLFGDQESLAAEAFAMSKDHGDTWPISQQTPVTAAGTGVDRQWISPTNGNFTGGPFTSIALDGIFSYHIPLVGEYVSGISTTGVVVPALITAITNVSQSGDSKIDSTGGPGNGWFWQSYRTTAGYMVATVPLSKYQDPTAYHVHLVTADVPQVFPWLALDNAGNAYATWIDPGGQLWMSYSLITDKANDPARGGAPGTLWSKKVKVAPKPLGSEIFPEIVAGSPGRVAIAYDASADFTGLGDSAPKSPAARWRTYVSMTTNAFAPTPTFQTGQVSHRIIHYGTVCTSGTTCVATQGDRSLLDMINIAPDAQGRLGVVYTDNNNQFGVDTASLGSQGTPYVMFAKLAKGPSLLAGKPAANITYPTAYRAAAKGDATWPNVASGTEMPALDIAGDGVYYDGKDMVARIDLRDASAAGMTRDLAAVNARRGNDLPADRVQYVTWFSNGKNVFYLAMDQDSTGVRRAYGGKVNGSNEILNGSSAVGTTYDPQTGYPVTYTVKGNSLFLRAPMAEFGVAKRSVLTSYTSFSLVGPTNTSLVAQNKDQSVLYIDRVVDSSPPMDAVLQSAAAQPLVSGPGSKGTRVPTLGSTSSGGQLSATGARLGLFGTAALVLFVMAVVVRRRLHPRGTGS